MFNNNAYGINIKDRPGQSGSKNQKVLGSQYAAESVNLMFRQAFFDAVNSALDAYLKTRDNGLKELKVNAWNDSRKHHALYF